MIYVKCLPPERLFLLCISQSFASWNISREGSQLGPYAGGEGRLTDQGGSLGCLENGSSDLVGNIPLFLSI